MDTIQRHGCLRSVLHPSRLNWMWILLIFTPIHHFIGMFKCNAKDQAIFLPLDWPIIGLNLFILQTFRINQELIKELSAPAPGAKDLFFPTQYSQPFFTQCKACFWKQHWSYWRNPQYNAIRFFMTIVIGILFGIIFWNKGQQM